MVYIPAAMPQLLVVGSSHFSASDGANVYMPVVCFRPSNNRIEAHYLRAGVGTSSYAFDLLPQGSIVNVAPDVIASFNRYSGGACHLLLYKISTMSGNGAAYSTGGTNVATAIKTSAYATTINLAITNVSNIISPTNTIILPYTTSQCLVVMPRQYWIINLSDGTVAATHLINTANATYSRFLEFSDFTNVKTAPVLLPDGTMVCYFKTATNAVGGATSTVHALVKINVSTGATIASNYTSLSALGTGGLAYLAVQPDGVMYGRANSSTAKKISADITTVTDISGSFSTLKGGIATDGVQGKYWGFGSSASPSYPRIYEITGTSATVTSKSAGGAALTWFSGDDSYTLLSFIDENRFLARTATGSGTGSSTGSYIGVYNKSDGSVATGYTKQQMIDYYGAMTIAGGGFENVAFNRGSLNFPDPTLYTVRNVVQLMGRDGLRAKVRSGGVFVTSDVKVRSGGAWVTPQSKARVGSSWV